MLIELIAKLLSTSRDYIQVARTADISWQIDWYS